MNSALILIDIQNDFLPGGALAVPDGDAVIPVANAVQSRFDLIVATQDWHPPDHRSFADHHEAKRPGDVITLDGLEQILWPTHCVQESWGAEFAPGLDRHRWAAIFQKGTHPHIDSYSGFFDNGHRAATGLDAFLRERDVSRVYILGLATDYCVKFTALDARQLGYEVRLITDGCRGVNLRECDVKRAIADMEAAGICCLDSSEV